MNVDPVLAAALAPLLRDLEAGHVPEPRIEEPGPPLFDQGEPGLMLYAPDGSGQGIRLLADAPRSAQTADLADQVQEWAVETLWSIGKSAVWPQCPEHPDSHPLKPEVANEYTHEATAVWQCPKSGHVIAPIGELPAS
jgi:hypothetical protein